MFGLVQKHPNYLCATSPFPLRICYLCCLLNYLKVLRSLPAIYGGGKLMFFCKGPESKCLKLYGPWPLWHLLSYVTVVPKQPKT